MRKLLTILLIFGLLPRLLGQSPQASRGKPNTRVTSRKVDGCFGRNLLTSGIPGARTSLATSLFPSGIRNQAIFGVAIGQWPTQCVARVFSSKRGELRQRYREGQED